MATQPRSYLAYMLRLWQVGSAGEQTWRAMLESPHTGERRGFANLDALFEFLREQTGSQSLPAMEGFTMKGAKK